MNKMNKKDMQLLVETAYLSWYTIRGSNPGHPD